MLTCCHQDPTLMPYPRTAPAHLPCATGQGHCIMDTLTKLYRIRRTCLEMLKDRGYLVSEVRLRLRLRCCTKCLLIIKTWLSVMCRTRSIWARTCSETALARFRARMISPSWCLVRMTRRSRCATGVTMLCSLQTMGGGRWCHAFACRFSCSTQRRSRSGSRPSRQVYACACMDYGLVMPQFGS